MTSLAYKIQGGDYSRGGLAAYGLKEFLKRIGADPDVIRRATIAAYEAEMNVVIHAYRGEMRVEINDTQIEVAVEDEGPGIADIELAMREGYSTAPPAARELGFGAGMGLPNIKKNTDQFIIESTVDQGTRLRFAIWMRPQRDLARAPHSIRIVEGRCVQCLRCLHACPTRALRVRQMRPRILEHLCIDCGACVAACERNALTTEEAWGVEPRADALLAVAKGKLLIAPPAFLAQFGAGVEAESVREAFAELGFSDVLATDSWHSVLRKAVLDYACQADSSGPVISPVCPVVLNLVQLRFPSLIPSLAPFLSPAEAMADELKGRDCFFVAACPAERTVLISSGTSGRRIVVSPGTLREIALPVVLRLARAHKRQAERSSSCTPAYPEERMEEVLEVFGIEHVMKLLDQIEDRKAADLKVVELYACSQGCFGSPLRSEHPFIAAHRWKSMGRQFRIEARAMRRAASLRAREGVRLDPDMGKAIEKLSEIENLARHLPGRDCAFCGAPTCDAFAEDVVLGRAQKSSCPHIASKQESKT